MPAEGLPLRGPGFEGARFGGATSQRDMEGMALTSPDFHDGEW